MKNRTILGLLFFILIISGCDKTEDGSYVAPISIPEKIAGTWTISDVFIWDEIAKLANADIQFAKVSKQFGFETFEITFNVDEQYNPTTFEVGGTAPALFLTSGYWDLDSYFTRADGQAVQILLYADASKSQVIDQLSIIALPGKKQTLTFSLIRYNKGAAYVSYQYTVYQ